VTSYECGAVAHKANVCPVRKNRVGKLAVPKKLSYQEGDKWDTIYLE